MYKKKNTVIILSIFMFTFLMFSGKINSLGGIPLINVSSNSTLNTISNIVQRTANTEVVKNSDGTRTFTIYGADVFLDKNKGSSTPDFIPINDSLFPVIVSNKSGYVFQLDNIYSKYNAYFKNNSNTVSAVRFEKDGYFFEYDVSGGRLQWHEQPGFPARTDTLGGGVPSNSQDTIAEAYNNTVIYKNAFSNTNLTYSLHNNMMKETFILSGLPSIKDYTYLEYTGNIKFNRTLSICANDICYVPKGTQDDFETSGRIDFKNASNDTIFYLPSPVITDSANNSVSGMYSVHGSDAQMNFWLRIPTSFLQTATFPIYIDPTVTLQSQFDDVKDAYVDIGHNSTNYGTEISWTPTNNRSRLYLNFNISYLYNNAYSINNSYLMLKWFSGGSSKFTIYQLYNDWSNSTGTDILNETQLTWNNQPCGLTLNNDTNCNLTSEGRYFFGDEIGLSISFLVFNITKSMKYNFAKSNLNVSYMINSSGSSSISSYLREGTVPPALQINYFPFVDIVSPEDNGIYTNNVPFMSFNVSTNENMTSCFWSPDYGISNYTMTRLNDTYFSDLNYTMPDGYNNVTYFCNNTANLWRKTETIIYAIDSLNITKCNRLITQNASQRTYLIINDIADATNSSCFIFDLNSTDWTQPIIINASGNYINKTNGYLLKSQHDDYYVPYIKNLVLYGNLTIISPSSQLFYNVTFINLKAYGQNRYIIANDVGINNFYFNSILNNTNITDANSPSSAIGFYLHNVTYQNTSETLKKDVSEILRYWNLYPTVQNNLFNLLSGATVSVYNSTGGYVESENTSASGTTSTLEFFEYIHYNNKSINETRYFTPHTINISKAGYATNSTIFNLTALKSDVYHNVTLYDNQAPSITINSPIASNLYTNNNSISLNYDVTDNLLVIDSCWYKVINSSGDLIIDNATIASCLDINFELPGGDTDYNLTIYANDTMNNIGTSSVGFGIRTDIPAVNINYPLNNVWITNGTDVLFNYTATFKTGIDTCRLYSNFTGTWKVNYTWVSPTNATANWTYINLSDNIYNWNIACNNSLNLIGWAISNLTLNIDTIYPTVSLSPVVSTLGSKIVYFNNNISDNNLNTSSCKYSVYNSTGQIYNSTENVSFVCNGLTSITLADFGVYNLTIYASDYANQESSTSEQFSVSDFPSSSGGGAFLSVASSLHIPVIGINASNLTNQYDSLELEIIYAKINDKCLERVKAGQTVAIADYSNICNLYPNDLGEILKTLSDLGITITIEDLRNFYESYKNQNLFQGYETQGTINSYGLFTSILGNVNALTLVPPSVSRTKIIFSSNTNITITEIVYSNKPLKSCEVLNSNSSFSCQITNGTLRVSYSNNNLSFFNKRISEVVIVTSKDSESNVEQKKVPITLDIYNLNYELIGGIPAYALIISFFVIMSIFVYAFYKKSTKRTRDIFATQ